MSNSLTPTRLRHLFSAELKKHGAHTDFLHNFSSQVAQGIGGQTGLSWSEYAATLKPSDWPNVVEKAFNWNFGRQDDYYWFYVSEKWKTTIAIEKRKSSQFKDSVYL